MNTPHTYDSQLLPLPHKSTVKLLLITSSHKAGMMIEYLKSKRWDEEMN